MITFLLVVHIIIAAGLVFFILMQQSEGGASGFVSGSMGGFMSIRGTANFLTRTTAILATLFFASSILLAIVAKGGRTHKSIIEAPVSEPKQVEKKPAVPIAGDQKTEKQGDEPSIASKTPPIPPQVKPTTPPATQEAAPQVEPKVEKKAP